MKRASFTGICSCLDNGVVTVDKVVVTDDSGMICLAREVMIDDSGRKVNAMIDNDSDDYE